MMSVRSPIDWLAFASPKDGLQRSGKAKDVDGVLETRLFAGTVTIALVLCD